MFPMVVGAYGKGKFFNKGPELLVNCGEDCGESIDLNCEIEHIDGTMNAGHREKLLGWLKDDISPNSCRILSNVRCLSEGVDVPSLDAVLFLAPRKSQVDVVQAVGRVMGTAPGKKMGYIILPVAIPAGMDPRDALDGDGTFITRPLQSGLIPQKALADRCKNGIYANEIVLLAYYIAAVNIESSFRDIVFKVPASIPGFMRPCGS
ncbi:MAG: hypothetical protein LBB18_01085 [Puniceicoccales bacterium]|jgi:predicted helicase|nr:hypothetical protein [Puniceicoccales bacterium]